MMRINLMRFLLCAGVHGREKCFTWLEHTVKRRKPDGILFAGGIIEPFQQAGARAVPRRLTHDDGCFVEHFFKSLGGLGVFTALIPGPLDLPLEEVLRAAMSAELEFPSVHCVHATLVEERDLAIAGIGGPLVEHASEVDHVTRTMAEYWLRPFARSDQSRKLLLLSSPPTGALGGSVGSALAGQFIDSYHPAVCIVNGHSDHRGVQQVAKTLVINPGCLADGCAAWLDLSAPAAEQVEWLDLHETHKMAADVGVCD
jgi:Icc-related predicted phosphoesterase